VHDLREPALRLERPALNVEKALDAREVRGKSPQPPLKLGKMRWRIQLQRLASQHLLIRGVALEECIRREPGGHPVAARECPRQGPRQILVHHGGCFGVRGERAHGGRGTEAIQRIVRIKDQDGFAYMLSSLRIVERMYHAPYDMQMTSRELEVIPKAVLLKRLCNRSQHLPAFRIATFLRKDPELITPHWASCLVRTENPDFDPDRVMERLRAHDIPANLVDNEIKAQSVPLLTKKGEGGRPRVREQVSRCGSHDRRVRGGEGGRNDAPR